MELPKEFRHIKGYENKYVVTPNGDVYSIGKIFRQKLYKRQNIIKLKPAISNVGYKFVMLGDGKKMKVHLVHRLVAEAYIPNPHNLPEVNHIDEDKLNNDVSNLEWCTVEYNRNYGDRGAKIADSNRVTAEIKRMMNYEKWFPQLEEKINKSI